jgi:YbgC/YbaW family acyl-CoA thioester hydrolase
MDSSGVIPLSVLASYMEHTRWQSIQGSEFALASYWKRGVIRAQHIEVLMPVRFDTELSVDCSVGRIGRTSLDLCHRVRRVGDGQLVAQATVTAVNLDETGRPAPLDPGAEELLSEPPALPSVALDGESPRSAWGRAILVCPSDQDVLQHVNHARYIEFVEDTRALAARAGAYADASEAAQRMPRRIAISYERQAAFGDTLEVSTWALEGKKPAFGFELRRVVGNVVPTELELVVRARVEV